jgi:hypothetical protein
MSKTKISRRTWILILVLVLGMIPGLVSAAVTISFSNLNMVTKDDIEIYGQDDLGNWTSSGIYNTTSTGIILDDGNYNFVVRPKSVDLIATPQGTLESLGDFVQTNLVALIIGVFLLGIVVWKR